MKIRERYLLSNIYQNCLEHEKMAFITGPRQVGKSTLAQSLAKNYDDHQYYNWDLEELRRQWKKSPSSLVQNLSKNSCVIFDEIHKISGWKRTLKGIYDIYHSQLKFIVTGSAQLDTFRRGGDSLTGRYFSFHLHPYSLAELVENKKNSPNDLLDYLKNPQAKSLKSSIEYFEQLKILGGFPDPFEKQQKNYLEMWRLGRLEKMIREDLRDLTRVTELARLEILASLINERVGSLFSLKSLSEDLEVSQPTLKQWLGYLEGIFYQFTLRPFSKHMSRALKKDSKMYLWDWSVLNDKGKCLENIVALALLKSVHYWSELGYGKHNLHFYRDKEKREVDFVITKNENPIFLIEVKSSDKSIDRNLIYLSQRWPQAQAIQLVDEANYYRKDQATNIHVMSLVNFLERLV